MKQIRLLILVLSISFTSISQVITVIDKTNLQPIENVAIYSDNVKDTAFTHMDGKADLSAFKGSELIQFIHDDYFPKFYSYSDIASGDVTIYLSEKTISLEEVVVAASRFEEKAKNIAQPVQVITSRELAFMNQQTTADVITQSGNVMVQKSQLGGGSPVIRGFETNKVLMVVDGVRMNNAIYRGGHLQNILTLDNSIMNKVEIVFGPGSVIYGSDALGGVMSFQTKNPILSENDKPFTKTNGYTRYSSAANEFTGHADFSIANKKLGSLTSFSYSNFGDLRQGGSRNPFYGDWGKRKFYVERVNGQDSTFVNEQVNIQKQSGYTQYDILQKFMFKPNKNIEHIVNLQFSNTSDIPRYDRLNQVSGDHPKYGQWYYGPQKRFFASYSLKLKSNRTMYDQALFIVGYQNIEESRHTRRYQKEDLGHRTEQLDIVTANFDFAKKIGKNEFKYGIEGWYNDVTSTAYTENIISGAIGTLDTRYPDGGSSMQSVAGYITHSIEINQKLILTDGLRLSNVVLNAHFKDTTFFPFPFESVTQNNTALNGNIGLVLKPGHDWRFSLLGSSGFRAPNVDDLSKVFDSSPGKVIVPNPDIKPEYTYNIDFGFSKVIKDQITLGASMYYTAYQDAITIMSTSFNGQDSILYDGELSEVTMNVNAKEAYIYGFNMYLNADITENFSITNTINYTYGRIKADPVDMPLDHISPVFGKSSFNLRIKQFRGEFFVMYSAAKISQDYNLQGEDNHVNSADPIKGYTPAWATLNLRTAFQFSKHIQLQVALENMLDQNYRVFASNIGSPGRNLSITLRANM